MINKDLTRLGRMMDLLADESRLELDVVEVVFDETNKVAILQGQIKSNSSDSYVRVSGDAIDECLIDELRFANARASLKVLVVCERSADRSGKVIINAKYAVTESCLNKELRAAFNR